MVFFKKFYILFAVIIYTVAIMFAQNGFLYDTQSMFGFKVGYFDLVSITLISILIVPFCFLVPSKIKKPSHFVILVLFVFIYIPSIVISATNGEGSSSNYIVPLFSFAFSFFIILIAPRVFGTLFSVRPYFSHELFCKFIYLSWSILLLILLYTYHDVMSISSLDLIYLQRELGKATSPIMGYVQIYFAQIFTPIIFALGLFLKKRVLLALGCIGFVVSYSITAEKSFILLPIMIFFLFKGFLNDYVSLKNISITIFSLGVCVLLVSLLYLDSVLVALVGLYLVARVVATPGIMFVLYNDFSSQYGFTYWTHVKGVSQIVDIPSFYFNNPNFPEIGRIVAEYGLGIKSNSNANFIAADGIAALGSVGIVVISIFFSVWLVFLDNMSRSWNTQFVCCAMFPVIFAFTNGSFFTIMLSFGGIFWIFLLAFFSNDLNK